MNTTIATLLYAPLLVTGLAAQRATQETGLPKVGSRRLVDVSVEGLGEASRRAPGGTTRGGSLGLSMRPLISPDAD